jgi:hypothetical protein
LEKIHPPIYWKPLNYKPNDSKKKTMIKKFTKPNSPNSCERLCSDACNYTTLIYKHASIGKGFRVFIDFEHNGLQHATWKEAIERKHLSKDKFNNKDKPPMMEFPWSDLNNKQQSLNDQYLKRQELARYYKLHTQKDNLFELDKTSYPNRPMPMSRRPRDALHIDFYQAACFKGSNTEATFKTFYHRKYLVNYFKIVLIYFF